MTKNMDVIEMNGNLYDALTGAYVGKAHTAGPVRQHQPHAVRTAHTAQHSPQHVPAHKPQRPQTLMRHAVQRPQPAAPMPAVQAQAGPVISSVKPAVPIHTPKATAVSLDPVRHQRAQATGRSQMVSRFGGLDVKPAAASHAGMPARSPFVNDLAPARPLMQPKPMGMGTGMAAPVTAPKKLNYHLKPAAKPDYFAANTLPSSPARPQHHAAHGQRPAQGIDFAPAKPALSPQHNQHNQQAQRPQHAQPVQHYRRPHPATIQQSAPRSASRPVQHDEAETDMFEQALASARSHEEKAPKQSLLKSTKGRKRARRVLAIAASAAAFVLLSGFIAYQNKASIQLEMASAKAGFAASAPLYKPDGYNMSRISYEPGTVETTYSDGDVEKGFDIIQKKSNWDSQTLLENFVAGKNGDYQGYQSGGRTVYVYGKGKATWVNGGTWYQLDATNAGLNDEQLVKVAASM